MAMAKAIKKLAKKLPIGDRRVQVAIASDDKEEIGKPVNYKETAEQGFIIDGESSNITQSEPVSGKISVSEMIERISKMSVAEFKTIDSIMFNDGEKKQLAAAMKQRKAQLEQEAKPQAVADVTPVTDEELIKACKNQDQLNELLAEWSAAQIEQHESLIASVQADFELF